MDPAVRSEIDAYLAEVFGLPVEALHRAGVYVVPAAAGDDGVVLFRVGPASVVVVEQERLEAASAIVASLDPEAVFNRTIALSLAGAGAAVHGPSWHGYLHRLEHRASRSEGVARLDPADPRLVELRDRCAAAEWREAGFPMDPATTDPARSAFYGVSVDGGLAAAGNLTDWRRSPADVGLLTRPDHRRRGLATRVASTMISDRLPTVGIIRYRALTTNIPSLTIAHRLGFEGYGQNIFARARSS